ncbi:MAG: endonuclease i [Bacteroidetes bacterium]|nr:endonuclease i [Bacteroidota bacterium]
MKKFFFSVIAIGALSFSAIAGTLTHASGTISAHKSFSSLHSPAEASASRATVCDTLININLNSADTNAVIYTWASGNVGYITGSGALFGGGTTYFKVLSVGELFSAPSPGSYVTSATAFYGVIKLNAAHSDSILPVTAYVYDTTGTAAFGGIGLGTNPIDSASTTTGAIIANQGGAFFAFTHQATLPGRGYYVMISVPTVTGDSLALLSNDGSTGRGRAWINTEGGDISVDSVSNLVIGNYILSTVCKTSVTCPTITVATGHTSSTAWATPTGGVAPYTYSWNTTPVKTTDTVTGLTAGSYSVTATDNNGCTGVGTVTIAGINDLTMGVTDFSVYPNPSNGVFTASVSLESASDITISVVDMTGNKVFESTDRSVKELSRPINLSSIATGIYIVNVKTTNGNINKRITVK